MLGGEAMVFWGHEGVREALRDLYGALDWFKVEVSEIRDLGDRLVALGRLRVRGKVSGAEAESPAGWVAEFKNGKAVRVAVYLTPRRPSKPPGCGSRRCRRRTLSCFGGSLRPSTEAILRARLRSWTLHRSSSFLLSGLLIPDLADVQRGPEGFRQAVKCSGRIRRPPCRGPRADRRRRSGVRLGHLPGPWRAEWRGDELGALGCMDHAGRPHGSLAGVHGAGRSPQSCRAAGVGDVGGERRDRAARVRRFQTIVSAALKPALTAVGEGTALGQEGNLVGLQRDVVRHLPQYSQDRCLMSARYHRRRCSTVARLQPRHSGVGPGCQSSGRTRSFESREGSKSRSSASWSAGPGLSRRSPRCRQKLEQKT